MRKREHIARRPQASRTAETRSERGGLAFGVHAEVVAALVEIFMGQHRLDKVAERRLRAHRDWSEATRQSFIETLHDTVRHWRLRWRRAGLPEGEYLEKVEAARARQVVAAGGPVAAEGTWSEAVRASVPDWLHARAAEELGTKWMPILAGLNRPAPLFLRANTLRIDRAALAEELAADGVATEPVPGLAEALRATGRRDVFRTKAFREGKFEVQDVHSQHIAPLLQVEPGMRVIDACAGVGGKSLHLAALMRNKGRVVALDKVEWKLAELRRRAARAGVDNLEARLVGEAREWKRLHGSADRVLIDAPCSGTGVWRRNPDAKWKLQPEELERLQALQAELLRDYRRLVKPGGKLLYATCSVLPSENEWPVRDFLAEYSGWELEEEARLRPGVDEGDGFYAARLVRAPGGE